MYNFSRPLVAEGRTLFDDAVYVMPDIHTPQGNSYFILGEVMSLLRQHGATEAQVEKFHAEATCGNREHLEATVRKWVHCVRLVPTYVFDE